MGMTTAVSIEAHERWMRRALGLADAAAAEGEVPVGAVLVADGEMLGEGYNRPVSTNDATAHAEIVALRSASARAGNYRLPDTTLYVTIEPCTMCVGALVHARIGNLVFGAREPKGGAVFSRAATSAGLNHRFDVLEGVLEVECRERLQSFFAALRRRGGPPCAG